MPGLVTTFNETPYWDDYDPNKQYYRILFRPKLAVQTREVNQLQTMIQEQIKRHADHIFKDGSVVSGCNITRIPRLDYVRINNQWADASGNITLDETFYNCLVVSNTTGLRANVQLVKTGFSTQYPNTNTLYINYINSGSSGGNEVVKFVSGETLSIYNKFQSKHGNVLDINKKLGEITVLTEDLPEEIYSTGYCYAVTVGDGVVYQKGYFVKVLPHTVRVKDYDTDTTNMLVGFETTEAIITYLQDLTLLDPVDNSNRNAIGADRLKLSPNLVSKSRLEILEDDDFFPIIEFNNEAPIIQRTDPQYAALGDYIARGTYEPHGDFWVKPIIVSSEASSNVSNFNYLLNAGLVYAKGNRVELIATKYLEAPRATSTAVSNATIATLNYGSYVLVDEFTGTVDFTSNPLVDIYDAEQNSISDREGSSAGASGSKIGEARLKMVVHESGTKGNAEGRFRFYLSDITMNATKSFSTQAKSIVATGLRADLVPEANTAVIKEASSSTLIFPIGATGLKRLRDGSGGNDTQFEYRAYSTGTLQSNGSVTFTLDSPHAGGTERFFVSSGTLSTANKLRVDVALGNTVYSAAKTGTVAIAAANLSITGTSTTFSTEYKSGQFIRITNGSNNHIRRITSIANNTVLTMDALIPETASGLTHRKYYLQGTVIDLADTTVTVNSNTQFTVDMNIGGSLTGTPTTAYAAYPVLRTGAVEKKKTPRRSHFVKIDCSSGGTTGPWSLGWPDVFAIENVYVGTTYADSNPDRANWFTLDTGQTPTSYGLSKLVLKPQYVGNLTSSSRILIKMSFFEADSTTGIGFFSVDSYPCRLPGVSANSSNMSFAEIPNYQGYDLRNSVDFRMTVANTAVKATVAGSATINPSATQTYSIAGSGTYLAEPSTNFQADIEYYLPRIDLIQVNKDGIFNVKSSTPSLKPITPAEDGDATTLSVAYVPPFPSITSAESSTYPNSEKIRNQVAGNRTWTMKDITGLAQRIDRLEYYQTLSMLEAQAKDYVIPDENGLDRFKNGIFADPFNNHALGDVSNFEYNIAIDEMSTTARPLFKKSSIDLNVDLLSNTTAYGNIISLPYGGVDFIVQPYASKIRNATESVWQWAGDMSIYPSYDYHTDETLLPEVNVVIDNASAWEQFANSPFGTNFGEWRTVSTNTKSTVASAVVGRTTVNIEAAGSPGSGGGANGGGAHYTGISTATAVTTTTTTTERLNRAVTSLNVGSTSTTYDLGTYVTDFTISPYIRAREVAFIAKSMKPNTRYYIFFDGKPVSTYCAPGVASSAYNVNTGAATVTVGKESQVVRRTGAFGAAVTADSDGNIYGIFAIPDGQFRVGDRTLLIANVSDLIIGSDAITSSASAVYSASSVSVTKKSASITTIDPVLSTTTTNDTKINTNVTQKSETKTTNPVIGNQSLLGNVRKGNICASNDPLGQSFFIDKQEGAPGIFLESIEVFFNAKDPSMGITCFVCETIAGVPDASNILAKSYLKPSQITVSNDASSATKFEFKNIPYLANDKFYAFFLMPDGNSPEYTVWMSEVGGTDILTNTKIFSNPYVGVAYKSSNSNSWTPLQTEDIKFNLKRCNFTSLSGTVNLVDDDRDYFTVDGFTIANNQLSPQVGDVVYSQYANGTLNVSNTAPFGVVYYVDTGTDDLIIDDSTGGFTANTIIQIHRPTQTGNVSAIGTGSKIATSTIVSVDDIDYSIVVPRVGTVTPIGTQVTVDFKGTSTSESRDSAYSTMQMEYEREFNDQMRRIRSTSNRLTLDESVDVKLNLYSNSTLISPIIDMRRKNLFVVENIINNDIDNEHTRYGDALTKYVSKQVILKEGQDAEDILVYITGHRPAGTDIHCYVKFLNAEDPGQFYTKLWTKLELTEGTNIRNNALNPDDFSEYGYSVPLAEAQQGEAYLNSGILTYRDGTGSVFSRYKAFAIKLVLVSDRREIIPMMRDVRSICLQR